MYKSIPDFSLMILTAVREELCTGPAPSFFLTSRLVYSGAGSHSGLVGTCKVEGYESSKCRGIMRQKYKKFWFQLILSWYQISACGSFIDECITTWQ